MGETKPGNFPLLRGREIDPALTFYICEDYRCLTHSIILQIFSNCVTNNALICLI